MTQIQVVRQKLVITSSLNNYVLCDNCNSEKQFKDKRRLQIHISRFHKSVVETPKPITNQVTQKRRKSRQKQPNQTAQSEHFHSCQVCRKQYVYLATLRYHIRRTHFNLLSKTPYHQQKKVNQVWFERVRNSDTVIEVHKTGVNSLVLRRLGKNTAIKVQDAETDVVDLSDIYPTFNQKKKVKCA